MWFYNFQKKSAKNSVARSKFLKKGDPIVHLTPACIGCSYKEYVKLLRTLSLRSFAFRLASIIVHPNNGDIILGEVFLL